MPYNHAHAYECSYNYELTGLDQADKAVPDQAVMDARTRTRSRLGYTEGLGGARDGWFGQ